MTKIVETDVEDEPEEKSNVKEIEIGTFNSHVATAKKGIEEYKLWHNLTVAIIAMAHPNEYHRMDLRDKETLKRLEKEMDLKIDYEYLDSEILHKPFLIQPNGYKGPIDRTVGPEGRPVTKKQAKAYAKVDKLQAKIDVFQKKLDNIKNKKCDRARKLKEKIDELEKTKERTI